MLDKLSGTDYHEWDFYEYLSNPMYDIDYEFELQAKREEHLEGERDRSRGKGTCDADWARHDMWCELIPRWSYMGKTQRKKASHEFAAKFDLLPNQIKPEDIDLFTMPTFTIPTGTTIDCISVDAPYAAPTDFIFCDGSSAKHSLGNLPTSSIAKKAPSDKAGCINKEPTMRDYYPTAAASITVDSTSKSEAETKAYLDNRLNNLRWTKENDLRKPFNMDDLTFETVEEFLALMTSGKYEVKDEDKKKKTHGSVGYAFDYIRLRDPAKPKDEAGYTAALKKLYEGYQFTQDTIKVMPAADGLTALREFEAKTFH